MLNGTQKAAKRMMDELFFQIDFNLVDKNPEYKYRLYKDLKTEEEIQEMAEYCKFCLIAALSKEDFDKNQIWN